MLPDPYARRGDIGYLRETLNKVGEVVGVQRYKICNLYTPHSGPLSSDALIFLGTLADMLDGDELAFRCWIAFELGLDDVALFREDLPD